MQEKRIHTSAQLEAYAAAMLAQAWSTSDAMVIKAVYRDVLAGQWDRLWAVERLVHVQRTAIETRVGVEKMGRRLLQLVTSIYPRTDWSPLTDALKKRQLFCHTPARPWIRLL